MPWDDAETLDLFKQFMAWNRVIRVPEPSPQTGPLYLTDSARLSKTAQRRKRFDNHSLTGKDLRPSAATLRTKSTAGAPHRQMLTTATVASLRQRGLITSHEAAYIPYGEGHKLEMLVEKHFRKRPLLLAVDFEWSAPYDPEDHKEQYVAGPYRCYGVDVGIYSTGDFTLVVHHAQFNEDKWARPGPFQAKKGQRKEIHHNDNKWRFPACLRDVLNDEDVLCIGHTVKGDLTRVFKTFFEESADFTPTFCDVKTFWKATDKATYDKAKTRTLAYMMKAHVGLLLRKDPSIRRGEWRSMSVMSAESMQYAVLDALAALVLFRCHSGIANKKKKRIPKSQWRKPRQKKTTQVDPDAVTMDPPTSLTKYVHKRGNKTQSRIVRQPIVKKKSKKRKNPNSDKDTPVQSRTRSARAQQQLDAAPVAKRLRSSHLPQSAGAPASGTRSRTAQPFKRLIPFDPDNPEDGSVKMAFRTVENGGMLPAKLKNTSECGKFPTVDEHIRVLQMAGTDKLFRRLLVTPDAVLKKMTVYGMARWEACIQALAENDFGYPLFQERCLRLCPTVRL